MTTIPQGYKSTELGIIPETWSVKELGQILSIHHGKSQKDVEADDGEYPIMATGGQIGRSRSYLYNKPSVLIGRKGTIDKPQFIDTPFWTVDTLFYTSIRPDYDPFFTYSACCCIDWESYNEGTCVPSLISSTIEKIKLPIPSDITEQRSIATALADVDALIEAKRALLEKKRAIKQGTMQELLTGNRRLPGFPVTPMKHTEIGDLPEDWEVSITKKCLSMPITDGPHETPTLCDDGIPFISAESVSSGNGRIDFSRMRGYISEAYHQECCKKYKPQVNDVYIIKSGSTTGKVAIVKTSQVFNIWSPLAVLRARQSIDPDFLFYSVQSNYYQEQIIQAWGMGTQQNIGMRTLERLKIAYPEYAEQRAIATALSDIDEEIEGVEHELSKLCNLKQGMMQNLLTGRIRLV